MHSHAEMTSTGERDQNLVRSCKKRVILPGSARDSYSKEGCFGVEAYQLGGNGRGRLLAKELK